MIPIVASAGADAGAAVQHAIQHDIQHYMRPGTLQLAALPPLSLYVHLPWCLKKCPYCDFNSHEQPAGPLPERRYIDAVVAALEAALPLTWGRGIHTIFIGGGTPTPLFPRAHTPGDQRPPPPPPAGAPSDAAGRAGGSGGGGGAGPPRGAGRAGHLADGGAGAALLAVERGGGVRGAVPAARGRGLHGQGKQ